jgi:hypothetical protein
MGEKYLYPTFLGIDWAYNNYVIIDLKKEFLIFEEYGVKFSHPLDLFEGPKYIEPSNENTELDILDQLYTSTIGKRVNYINPTADRSVSWQSIQSAGEDSEVVLEN